MRARTADTSSDQAASLGPLKHLPGTWVSGYQGGWNMIALPHAAGMSKGLDYRLMVNQFEEELNFTTLDENIRNRGVGRAAHLAVQTDQSVVALDYEQLVRQIDSEDYPATNECGDQGLTIHHEPGLWLHMLNETADELDIARMATVPHGDVLLAMGQGFESKGGPEIPHVSGLPVGVDADRHADYLMPYRHFADQPFQGMFDPNRPNDLLHINSNVKVLNTTTLHVDTRFESGGIKSIPFLTKQANATEMQFTLWLQELDAQDDFGNPLMRLQYSQLVMLEFYPRRDGVEGLIKWPHVSINTLYRSDQLAARKGLRK